MHIRLILTVILPHIAANILILHSVASVHQVLAEGAEDLSHLQDPRPADRWLPQAARQKTPSPLRVLSFFVSHLTSFLFLSFN